MSGWRLCPTSFPSRSCPRIPTGSFCARADEGSLRFWHLRSFFLTGLAFREVGRGTVSIERAQQPTTDSAPSDDGAIALDTVLVTAQKRAEPDPSVPITVTALSQKTLDLQRVQNLSDVSRLVPGLLFSTFSENSPTIAIRGANNTFEQMGVNKPVAVVVDDVFMPRTSGSVFELFDLQSLVVLEGPQGTLFGRNVTGGVILTSSPV